MTPAVHSYTLEGTSCPILYSLVDTSIVPCICIMCFHVFDCLARAPNPLTTPILCRSMFVADRQYLTVDPARSLYSRGAYYASTLAVNSVVTIANAVVFMLLLYSMMGANAPRKTLTMHVAPITELVPLAMQLDAMIYLLI